MAYLPFYYYYYWPRVIIIIVCYPSVLFSALHAPSFSFSLPPSFSKPPPSHAVPTFSRLIAYNVMSSFLLPRQTMLRTHSTGAVHSCYRRYGSGEGGQGHPAWFLIDFSNCFESRTRTGPIVNPSGRR